MRNADKRSIINILFNSVVNIKRRFQTYCIIQYLKFFFNRFCKLLTIDYYIVIYHEYIKAHLINYQAFYGILFVNKCYCESVNVIVILI